MTSLRAAAVGSAVVVLAGVIAGTGAASAATRPAYTPLAGSAVPLAARAAVTGPVPATTKLSVQVWLKPRTTAAEALATAVSTPGNARYGHYLSPAAFTAAYGPSAASAAAVASWLRAQGFTGISSSPGRSYIGATAPVSIIDSAFRTKIKYYRPPAGVSAGRYPLRANSTPVSVPSSLSGQVLGVTGLDNTAAAPAKAAPRRSAACSRYYGQHMAAGWPKQFGVTSFPSSVCGYHASQLRAAYGANSTNTGRSQTIALVELGTQNDFPSLVAYAAAMKLPAPSKTRYQKLQVGMGSCDASGWADEEELDVEASYAMAPSAHQLVIGGPSCNNGDDLQSLLDADLAVVNGSGGRPLATIVSNSWGNNVTFEGQAPDVTSIEHAYLVQAAAEGVGMYFSTGDSSGVEPPATDPYATAVGGTTLGLGKSNNRLFETGWSTQEYQLSGHGKSWAGNGEDGAAGGGPSLQWAQPGYQEGVVPATLATTPGDRGGLVRTIPDLSADADPLTGMAIGDLSTEPDGRPSYDESRVGGTSMAAPLVAGIVADAQQGQPSPFGFLNPLLYQLAGTAALHDALPLNGASPHAYRGVWCDPDDCGSGTGPTIEAFDVQSPSLGKYTGQVTLSGYDTMTGLGTPNGQAFITALRAQRG